MTFAITKTLDDGIVVGFVSVKNRAWKTSTDAALWATFATEEEARAIPFWRLGFNISCQQSR